MGRRTSSANKAHVDIRAMATSIERMAGIVEAVGPALAKAVYDDLKRSIDAGETPYGVPWKLTLKGEKPLRNALSAVTVTPAFGQVFIRVRGQEAHHHWGAVRGGIKRPIIPDKNGKLPERMARALRVVMDQWFVDNVKG